MDLTRRARIATGVATAVATLAIGATSAAQEPPEPPPGAAETTTTTVVPSTTSTQPPPSTSTTLPTTTTTTTTSTTAPPTTIDDPAAGGDAPPETVPPEPVTVPPREGPSDPDTPTVAAPEELAGRVVTVDVVQVQQQAAEAIAAYEAAVATRQALEARLAKLRGEVSRLGSESASRVRELSRARAELRRTSVEAYLRGTAAPVIDSPLSGDHATDYYSRRAMLGSVVDAAEDVAARYRRAHERVNRNQAATAGAVADTQVELAAAKSDEELAMVRAETAQFEMRVFSAGGTMAIHGFVFPVDEPHNFVDTFGAPRMTGTTYEHWHQGTDIFAPAGTPLFAVERGVIVRMGTDVLGGIKLWVKGESGAYYYYAHLFGYAPGINEGSVVAAGTVVGYVGNTGNALTTPPHLHFEIHPGGGPAVNPYPVLLVADDQQKQARARLGTGLTSG